METWTVSPMAELLAQARPTFSAAYFARQIRGWAQLDLFPDAHLRGSGRTAAQVFNKHHLVSASIYTALASFGFVASQLQTVRACFNNSVNIQKIVRLYEDGDREWHFVLYLEEEGTVCAGGFQKEVKLTGMKVTGPNIIVLAPRTIFAALDQVGAKR